MFTISEQAKRKFQGGIPLRIIAIAGCGFWLGLAETAGANPLGEYGANGGLLIQPGDNTQDDLSIIENGLTLINDHASNRVQTAGASARGTTNRMTLTLSGTGNGGLGEDWPDASFVTDFLPEAGGFAAASLAPGSFVQEGTSNFMDVQLTGTYNLAAASQTGHGNVLMASVSGSYNLSAVHQSGTGNLAAYTQTGTNNIVGISQTSW